MVLRNRLGWKERVEEAAPQYDYSKTIWKNAHTTCTVICKIHGPFLISPKHIVYRKQGCPKCGILKNVKSRVGKAYKNLSTEDVIRKCREVHKDLYDYSQINFINTKNFITVVCRKHGPFQVSYHHHLYGRGCSKCTRPNYNPITLDRVKEVCRTPVADVELKGRGNLRLTCPIHGDWETTTANLLYKKTGCKKCTVQRSKLEASIGDYIKSLGINCLLNHTIYRNGKSCKEVDIFIPHLNLAIEINGCYWHSTAVFKDIPLYERQRYVRDKELFKHYYLKDEGIRLITIFDNELQNLEAVKYYLKNQLGVIDESVKARECEVKEVDKKEASTFLNTYHLHGYDKASVCVGLYYKGVIVSVMTFCKVNSSRRGKGWELKRYSTSKKVIGGFSRLLKCFIKHYNPIQVISYCHDRLFTGGVYLRNGFTLERQYKYDYFYTDGRKVLSKASLTKRILLIKYKQDTVNKSVFEILENLGFYSVFSPGITTYKLYIA